MQLRICLVGRGLKAADNQRLRAVLTDDEFGGALGAVDNAYAFTYKMCEGDFIMTTVTATEARAKLYKLIDEASINHEPVVITGKRGNAVLLAEGDWNAITETLHLLSVPGMRESIIGGMQEPLGETTTELEW